MTEVAARSPVRLAQEMPFDVGPLAISPASRQVALGDASVTLEPRVMQVLVALGREPGRIVGRDELIERCWHGVVVGDNAINRVISRLRALSCSHGGFAIETIAKVGYRLTVLQDWAAPQAAPAVPLAPSPPSPPSLPSPSKGTRRMALGALAAVGGGLALFGTLRFAQLRPDPAGEGYERALAQLQLGEYQPGQQALADFRELVRRYPDSSLAAGGLALALACKLQEGSDAELPGRLRAVAAAAARATQLESANADARVAEAIALPIFGRWGTAQRDYQQLRTHVGRHWTNELRGADLAMAMGNWPVARQRFAALVRDGLDTPGARLGEAVAAWNAGASQAADRLTAAALDRFPALPTVRATRLSFLAFNGQPDAARALAQASDRLLWPQMPMPPDLLLPALDALVSRSQQARTQAVAALLSARQARRTSVVPTLYWLAQLGDRDAAFTDLNDYFFTGSARKPRSPLRELSTAMLFAQPSAPIRTDPRFPALLRRIGLPPR